LWDLTLGSLFEIGPKILRKLRLNFFSVNLIFGLPRVVDPELTAEEPGRIKFD